MPNPFQPLHQTLYSLIEYTQVPPATGQAMEDQAIPDLEEVYDQHMGGAWKVQTTFEAPNRRLYRKVKPIPRAWQHVFRYSLDGSVRTYFTGTVIEYDRSSPAQIAQVGTDVEYVLGPESAHVNVPGISGLATKTSYIMFLIQSILQTVGASGITTNLLNVKYDAPLHIHETGMLSDEECRLYERMGLRPEPFMEDCVHYLLPWGKRTQVTGRPNMFIPEGEPIPPHKVYAYDLRSTVDKLDLLFSHVPDPLDTLGALIGEIANGIQNNEQKWRNICKWDDRLSQEPLVKQGVPQKVRNVAASSVGRFIRILRRVVKTRQSGIFVPHLSTRMTTIGQKLSRIRGGHVYVVDIARLTDEEQTLVFGDILLTIYGLYSGELLLEDEEAELPKKVLIFVDELNKYDPACGEASRSPILEQVLDISERGRSFGIVLFSAQQFLSAAIPA